MGDEGGERPRRNARADTIVVSELHADARRLEGYRGNPHRRVADEPDGDRSGESPVEEVGREEPELKWGAGNALRDGRRGKGGGRWVPPAPDFRGCEGRAVSASGRRRTARGVGTGGLGIGWGSHGVRTRRRNPLSTTKCCRSRNGPPRWRGRTRPLRESSIGIEALPLLRAVRPDEVYVRNPPVDRVRWTASRFRARRARSDGRQPTSGTKRAGTALRRRDRAALAFGRHAEPETHRWRVAKRSSPRAARSHRQPMRPPRSTAEPRTPPSRDPSVEVPLSELGLPEVGRCRPDQILRFPFAI